LILRPKQKGLKTRATFGGKPIQELSYRIGILLSSYSQAINKQNKTTGSLFQQRTKAKILCETYNGAIISYFEQCFHYVHQNPLRAGLVKDIEEWPYSSYRFYLGLEEESICNKEIFFDMTGLTVADIKMKISLELEEEKIKKIMD
jgi:putative transposase